MAMLNYQRASKDSPSLLRFFLHEVPGRAASKSPWASHPDPRRAIGRGTSSLGINDVPMVDG